MRESTISQTIAPIHILWYSLQRTDHKEESSLHIVVFPLLAFGHMLPFLDLSKTLAKRGHHISFLSTPRNILRLPKLPPFLAPLIEFIPILLPPCDNLPNNADATTDLLPDDVQYLKKAFDGLDQPIAKFLEQASKTSLHTGCCLAAELHIPCAMFNKFPGLLQRLLLGSGRHGAAEVTREAHRGARVDPLPDSRCLLPLRGSAVRLLDASRCFGGVGRLPLADRLTVQVHGSMRLHGIGSTAVKHHL